MVIDQLYQKILTLCTDGFSVDLNAVVTLFIVPVGIPAGTEASNTGAPTMNPLSKSLRLFPLVRLSQIQNQLSLLNIFKHATEHDQMLSLIHI